jgi:DNA processing protein
MQLTDAQRLDWLRLIRTEGVGPRTFRGLINRFGSAAAALDALPDLTRRTGKPTVPATKAMAEREMAAAARLGVRYLAMGEPDYPKSLHATDTAPPLIALRGEVGAILKPSVALVGSRNASSAGLAFTERLARGLSEAGLVVVSGVARGLDASAHRASLAGGHDKIYPDNHRSLVEAILEAGGALVAEMPMGWVPRGRDFPRRNRIISGLSLGTVVIEAARRSGSLITARFALEQGREVFAVPGSPLDPRAEGTNDLIRQGATLVAEVEHVLAVIEPLISGGPVPGGVSDRPEAEPLDYWDEIDLDGGDRRPAHGALCEEPPSLTALDASGPSEAGDAHARLLAALSPTPVGTDLLARATGLPVRVVQSLLMELELAGRIERHGSGSVSLRSRG